MAVLTTPVRSQHSYWAIRFRGLSLAGNGKGISRKPKTREGKLLPPGKGLAGARMQMGRGAGARARGGGEAGPGTEGKSAPPGPERTVSSGVDCLYLGVLGPPGPPEEASA